MKKWDKRQIRTFFCVIIFGFLMIMIAEAFGQLPIVSSVMLGTGTVLFVNMMPKKQE